MNLGVAYKWKELLAGVSFQNIIPYESQLQSGSLTYYNLLHSIHAGYDIALGKRFELTPRVIYTRMYVPNPNPLNADLTLTFNKKFSLGVMYDFNSGIGIHAEWNINDKFTVGYLYNSWFSKNNSNHYLNGRATK